MKLQNINFLTTVLLPDMPRNFLYLCRSIPYQPPSLSLSHPPSLTLSSTTIRFSYVTNVRAFCCCSCFCLEAIGAAVSICSNREKSEFEK